MKNNEKINHKYLGRTDFTKGHMGIIIVSTYLEDNNIFYGASYCSPKDLYNKKLGRELSVERLNKRMTSIHVLGEITEALLWRSVVSGIIINNEFPFWAKQLLKNEVR